MNEADTIHTSREYHALQRANAARNEAAGAKSALSENRAAVRRARERLQRALELVGEHGDAAVRDEIRAALEELGRS